MKELNEQEIRDNVDYKVTEILETLRDGVFRSAEKRAEFVSLISSLAISKDPRAKVTIKKLGDYLTDLGNDVLNPKENDEEEFGYGNINIEENKKYKRIFED